MDCRLRVAWQMLASIGVKATSIVQVAPLARCAVTVDEASPGPLGHNKAVVALANKLARIAWVVPARLVGRLVGY